MCCVPAPPVLEFDKEGNLLKSWGGPGNGYDWPDVEHGIFVDRAGNVWIGGNGPTSRQVLKFTNDGKFLKQIGHPSLKGPADSADTTLLGRPAGLEIDEGAHELYISDGYLNKRVIVFDSDTLAFKRMWGGYGNAPNDADPGPYKGRGNAPIDQQFRSPVHCAHISKDGLVYVCDRSNDRVQVFTKQGKFLKEFFVRPETLEPGTVCDIAFSHDAGQEYLLIADDTNNVIWTLRRSDGTVLGMMGHDGRNAGQFHAIHQLVSDSAGNLYSGEVETGKRIQKFLLVSGPTNSR
jgi:DNA-binding beta-propeller fold protein YncE